MLKSVILKNILTRWFLVALATTILFAAIYGTVQQDIRMSANDPQIQMAEDTASQLNNSESPSAVIPSDKVDISKSLAPYLIVFDNKGRPVASSAVLSGQVPVPPSGIFKSIKQSGEDRFTWEPANGVRSAAVVTSYTDGFVLAGRSMREVEAREDNLMHDLILGWLGTMIVMLACAAGLEYLVTRKV